MLNLAVNRHEAVGTVHELTATLRVLSIRGHRQTIITLATLCLGDSVHVEPDRYVICGGERKELRCSFVVVVVADVAVAHVELEAVVRVYQNSIVLPVDDKSFQGRR